MIKDLKQLKKNELGFTLIEVMVVIIMIGILAAIAVPIYTNYVYRARTSEGVSTLGAVKTYLMERRNAEGKWPSKDDIMDEFDNFRELYYFNPDINITEGGGENDNIITVSITPSENFDPPDDLDAGAALWLRIDWSDGTQGGWGGEIRDKWASHLKSPGA